MLCEKMSSPALLLMSLLLSLLPADQLFSCPNLALTPHTGSASEDTARHMGIEVAEVVIAILRGQKHRYLVNPDYVNHLY